MADVSTALVQGAALQNERMDAVFGELVKESWSFWSDQTRASQVDEVVLSAIIAHTLDQGYHLIDLTSDGNHHYVRFHHKGDASRVYYRVGHMTPDQTTARVIGHHLSLVAAHGRKTGDFAAVWKAVQAELRSGFLANPEPGTLTVDGDMSTGYIYAQIDLYLPIDRYLVGPYAVDDARLGEHLNAVQHALRKYLVGRFFGGRS
jgi:hypothetical protein